MKFFYRRAKIFFLILIILLLSRVFFIKNERRKNIIIIIISIDLLQAQHLYAYGYPVNTTPNLNSFFADSHTFLNAVSPSSWTLPSTISLFTSAYPVQHGMTTIYQECKGLTAICQEKTKVLSKGLKTIPEILKLYGYTTVAFINGNIGLQKKYGINRGFDYYYQTYKGIENDGQTDLTDVIKKFSEWIMNNKSKQLYIFLQGFDLHQSQIDSPTDYSQIYVKKPYSGIYTGTNKEYISY